MRAIQFSLALTVCVMATGCATQPPVEHVQLFRQAFTNLQTASQPLFDDLAAAERRQGQEVAMTKASTKPAGGPDAAGTVLGPAVPPVVATSENGKPKAAGAAAQPAAHTPLSFERCADGTPTWQTLGANTGFIRGFCIEDSPYYSELADPPATRAFRSGLAALGHYSELLVMLAQGTNVEAAKAQVETIGASAAVGLALVPGAQAGAVLIVPVLAALEPLIDAAAKVSNAAELKRLAIEASPQFSRLVFALQASSKEMFTTLTESSVAHATPLNLKRNPELGPELLSRIDGYRRVLSDFNVMLGELDGAHQQLVEALRRDAQHTLTLAAVADRAERLNRQAGSLRQAFMILRRGKP